MAHENRVTPFGEIVAIEQRGTFMGNRGSIHRGWDIVRPWQVRRWITCRLEYKGWVAPKWQPGRWTPLFFYDEAVALAAGHRPCALCRHADYVRWLDAWQAATGWRPGVDEMDRVMHADRVGDDRRQRRHEMRWPDVPEGAFALVNDRPALVMDDRVVPWSARGYGQPIDPPSRGRVTVLTPRCTIDVLDHGYRPAVHPSVAALATP